MSNGRKIPMKNYFILLAISLGVIFLTIYINKWIVAYKQVKISESPISEVISEVSLDDLDTVLTESNKVILYVSYTNNKEIYDLDKKLAKTINKYNYNDYIYYLNITDYLENDEYLNILGIKFNNVSDQINKAPMFIYFKNGEAVAIKDSNKRKISSKTLTDMIDMFDIIQ